MLIKIIRDQKDAALLITRIIIGVIFVAHGINKFQIGINTVSGFFASLGIPASTFFAWLIPLLEIIGGLALILGLFSRIFALVLSIIMLVALVKVKFSIGLIAPPAQPGVGMELDLALLAGLLSIFLQGSGKFSIDLKIFKKEIC
jgi:uncharacterized membrane protein YphA (DoxX/SURF4 family)